MKIKKNEEMGSDLEQIIAILERSEIDYTHQYEGENDEDDLNLNEFGSYIYVNDTTIMTFDEEGSLLEINSVAN